MKSAEDKKYPWLSLKTITKYEKIAEIYGVSMVPSSANLKTPLGLKIYTSTLMKSTVLCQPKVILSPCLRLRTKGL